MTEAKTAIINKGNKMQKQELIEKLNEAPFLKGRGDNTGRYEFECNIDMTDTIERYPHKTQEEFKEMCDGQFIEDLSKKVVELMLDKHNSSKGDFTLIGANEFFMSDNDKSKDMVSDAQQVAGNIVVGIGDLASPFIVSNNVDGERQVNSKQLSIIDVENYSYSFDDGCYSVAGDVVYSY